MKAGWSNKRCGSLITAIVGGRSRYGLVQTFIGNRNKNFALVNWLPVPTYPYGHPLVVFIRDDDPVGDIPIVLDIDCIDPCGVCVERCDTESGWYLMRLAGLDTIRR